jgi:hypothetical protein
VELQCDMVMILRWQVLADLVCEMPETEVAKRYLMDRGTVQVVQQLMSIVSHMVSPLPLLNIVPIFGLNALPIRSPSSPVIWDFGRSKVFFQSSVSASAAVHMPTSPT